jgi:hypothetical protein
LWSFIVDFIFRQVSAVIYTLMHYQHVLLTCRHGLAACSRHWVPGVVHQVILPASLIEFDFNSLVFDAIVRETELDDDDTEGHGLRPARSAFSLPTPLSPVSDNGIQSGPPPSQISHLASPPPLPLNTLSTPIINLTPPSPSLHSSRPHDVPISPGAASEGNRRKKRVTRSA